MRRAAFYISATGLACLVLAMLVGCSRATDFAGSALFHAVLP